MALTAARLRRLIPTCRNGEEFEQKLMALSIADSEVSVTIADPNLSDAPLVCCSDGFETLTGYSRSEAIGTNCRFLNHCSGACGMSLSTRQRLRQSVDLSLEFADILPNVKKSGEPFLNLFHMTSLVLRGRKYLIGVQADVTNVDILVVQSHHVEELRRIAECIFSSSLDAWVLMQSHDRALQMYSPFSTAAGDSARSRSQKTLNQIIICGLDCAAKGVFVPGDEDSQNSEECRLQQSASKPHLRESDPKETHPSGVSPEQKRAVIASPVDAKDRISMGFAGENPISDDAGDQLPSDIDVARRIIGADSKSELCKSVGSADHPNSCTECSFYFFSSAGCKNGVDCRFCHEVHPRKGNKRRSKLRKASTLEGDCQPNVSADKSGGAGAARPLLQQDPSADVKCATEAPSSHTADSVICSMSYVPRRDSSGPCSIPNEHIDLVVGERVCLLACIEFDVDKIQTLSSALTYSIFPTLPPSLDLDPNSGTICGVCESVHSLSVHTIVASFNCYAADGIFLLPLPVASCSLSLRVVGMMAGS